MLAEDIACPILKMPSEPAGQAGRAAPAEHAGPAAHDRQAQGGFVLGLKEGHAYRRRRKAATPAWKTQRRRAGMEGREGSQ